MTDSTPNPSENTSQPAPAEGAKAPVSPSPAPQPAKAETPAPPAPPETPKAPTEPAPAPAQPAPADAIPESYQIKPPEGVKLDDALITALTPQFKELGLSSAKAQKLAETFIGYQQKNAAATMAADLDRTMKDPEIGQMNWGRTLSEVNRALSAFTTPEDRKWMEARGDGNRLEYVRLFAKIGRAMAEDRPARGSPTSAEKTSVATKLYGGRDLVGNDKQ